MAFVVYKIIGLFFFNGYLPAVLCFQDVYSCSGCPSEIYLLVTCRNRSCLYNSSVDGIQGITRWGTNFMPHINRKTVGFNGIWIYTKVAVGIFENQFQCMADGFSSIFIHLL